MSEKNTEKSGRKTGRREALWGLMFVLAAAILLHLTGRVFRPVHINYGSTWEQYLAEPKNSIDVLFLGSSYAYCDWNPAMMYAESGLTGYVMGGSEQTPALTYWYLKEALRTQSPSVVVMEASSLFFDRYRNYTQTNVERMPWGFNRLGAIFTAAEPEKRVSLFFDLYIYHDRWKELTEADFEKLVPAGADHLKGHTAVDEVFPALEWSQEPFLNELSQSEEILEENMKDFDRIAALCREKGIDLIVTVNPTYSQYPQPVYDRLEERLTENEGVRVFDWRNGFEEMGLDVSKHLYDGGHLNQDGAKIFSAWTGRFLREQGYVPRAQTEENTLAWEAAAEYWQGLLG